MGDERHAGRCFEAAQPAHDFVRIGMGGQHVEIIHLRTNRHVFAVNLDAVHARDHGGAVGAVALAGAEAKAAFSSLQALIHGVLGNILVCLATWLCYSARTTTDKILAIVLPIAAFVAAGFEHSIANMYLFSFALLTKFGAPIEFWNAISKTASAFPHLTVLPTLNNLIWVTLGNMIGGVMVGVTYWFIYLRKRRTER